MGAPPVAAPPQQQTTYQHQPVQPVQAPYRDYGNPGNSYSRGGGGGSAMGWIVMTGGVAGLIGCFLPLTKAVSGIDGSLFGVAKQASSTWIYIIGLLLAVIIGLVVALASMGGKAGWYALAGVGAGFSVTYTLVTMMSVMQLGGTSEMGFGFWLILIGSALAMIFSIIGAFSESS